MPCILQFPSIRRRAVYWGWGWKAGGGERGVNVKMYQTHKKMLTWDSIKLDYSEFALAVKDAHGLHLITKAGSVGL